MKILVINTGSSSIKYQLFDMEKDDVLTSGVVEKIGESMSQIKHVIHPDSAEEKVKKEELKLQDHREGMLRVNELLMDKEFGVINSADEIFAVGHRAVHGGELFKKTVVIDQEVKDGIKKLSPLAPLHNPLNLIGIEVAEEVFPNATHVAVFDTAFHQTMPKRAYRYAVPKELYHENGVRAYGFHGTSHLFVSKAAADYLDKPLESLNTITVHLGNGCSMAAVQGGKCIDTSMGLSPLGGLVMGTRSGDIDPALFFFLGKTLGKSFDEIDKLLNKESGMKGLTGQNDLRDIEARKDAGEEEAITALDIYCYRIRKYIGSYIAALGGVDVIVFTAGVGENSPFVRKHSLEGLEKLGIEIDEEVNDQRAREPIEISTPASKVKVLVIPTNEELEIAHQTYDVVR
ncbi:acetate kinase [Flammeovirgaceae bacterium SG7u.111]|nr:acetate kinase [Flammeovirgaceae bacterium SG7u.132]WPO35267.1 acetate kinase [Flammeovirgaceae bacterium SG7u.111]